MIALSGCKETKPPVPAVDLHATVRFVSPAEGEVAPGVVQQVAKVKAEGRRVLVYVSAPWCEPCKVFHAAVERGELTGKLGALDLMAFDGEADAERLLMSGYEQRFIPAFTLPGADGRATSKHLEGSVKGEGAVEDLVPRLTAILAQ